MYYLKYRPKTISEIDNSRVKDFVKKILSAADMPHALLFVGQKGTGKTSTARIFAKAVNCLKNKYAGEGNGLEPCNVCDNCLAIDNSSFTDVIEMDAASNRGIEEVKNLIKETAFLPMAGRYRVFIIDEAHMITPDGFNALLKTLEEPPKSAIFILATTNPEKLPKTIISRCIKVNFGKANHSDIETMLKRIADSEKIKIDQSILSLIAAHSDDSFRDAAKIFEEIIIQKIATPEGVEKFIGTLGRNDLLKTIEEGDEKRSFSWIAEFSGTGGDFKILIESMLAVLHDLLLIKKGVYEDKKLTTKLTSKEISRLIKLLLEAYKMQKNTPVESLPLEIAITEFYNDKS